MVLCPTVRRGLFIVAAGWTLGLGAGCPSLSPYACGGDDDCDRAGEQGRCLADGACAYPETHGRCDSGWQRSPNAAVEPGACVPALPDATTTGGPTTGASSPDGASGMLSTGELPACGSQVRIEIDTAFLSASEVLEGYPLLVSLDSAAIVAGIAASGDDPVVLGPDDAILPSEVEHLDATAGTLALWVRLPAYALGQPLLLRLRWDGPEAPGDGAEVWAGTYAGVWHLGDGLSGIDGDELRNSARVDEPGLTAGQMQPEQSVPGVVGRALLFDGSDDVVTVDAEFVGQLQSYSISFWVRYDGADEDPGDYFQRLNGDSFYPRCWRIAGGSVVCQYVVDDTVTPLGTGLEHEVGQTLHVALVRDVDDATHRVYVDGEEVGVKDDPPGATLRGGDRALELGHGELGTLPGLLDEVRVAERPLSATWVRADYRTQLQPGAVLTHVSEPEPVPCPG